jgi:hypothetical protein
VRASIEIQPAARLEDQIAKDLRHRLRCFPPRGRIKEVIDNVESVTKKIKNFVPPEYQPKSEQTHLIVSEAGQPFNPSKAGQLDPMESEYPLADTSGSLCWIRDIFHPQSERWN